MNKKTFTFKREERLKSRKTIDSLFAEGHSFGQYPLRIVWTEVQEGKTNSPVQFALTVPKKKFRNASDRNRIRRLIREAYRLQKPYFYEKLPPLERPLAMMIIFTGRETPTFDVVYESMGRILRRLSKKYSKNISR